MGEAAVRSLVVSLLFAECLYSNCVWGYIWGLLCDVILCIHSVFAIISLRKRDSRFISRFYMCVFVCMFVSITVVPWATI